MTHFKDLPIRRKLLLMTLASSVAALTLVAGGFLAWDVNQFRSEIVQDMTAQAVIVAENSAAPLTFHDDEAAGETLAVLRLRPRVAAGCLYDRDGRLFASYRRDDSPSCPLAPGTTSAFDTATYRIVTDVTMDGARLGTLYIERDLSDLYARLRVGAATLGGLLLAAALAALLVASRMQRSIASPLLQLAETARAISSGRNYSLRATQTSNDEVGVVVQAFNDMLDRVAERNTELSRANEELEHEVEERRRVEVERTAALERERDANRLKDEFLATLSHELRTPLNAVLGWTRVLRTARVDDATQVRALESIERNAHAQARLIEDLLEISRIVTGKLRIQVQIVDLASIIDAAVDVVQPAAAAKRIRLTSEISVRPAMTSGDPDRLQQVVWNLLSNAVKFTPNEGTVVIGLDVADGYRITVRDSGLGINARFLPHVFEPFRQADGTTIREHGGLGLGLAIAKQLVELHGGTIEVRSPGVGEGATFVVRLPSVHRFAGQIAVRTGSRDAAANAGADPFLLRGLRVLVVDDHEDARRLIETTLAQYGAVLSTADSADAALAEFDRDVPDVLLSDIGMPHEDGYSLIRRLRARPVETGGAVPAIAITAYASAQDRQIALAAGYHAHMAKPFDPGELALLVAQLGRAAHSRG